MNEPKRWIEEGPPEAVERLLQAAEAEKPPEGSLGRVLAGMGAGLGATGAAATAGAAGTGAALATGKAVALGAWAKWLLLGVAAVGAGTAAVRQVSRGSAAPHVARTVTPVVVQTPPAAPVEVGTIAVAPTVEEPVVEVPRKQTALSAKSTRASAATAEAPIDVERLAEEVRVVDRARSALAAGHAPETLTALDEYESRFGGRRFAPEALYLRMQALLSLGRKAEARSIAERLLAAFPQSPQTARARRVLESIP